MKKIILSVLFPILVSQPVFAQDEESNNLMHPDWHPGGGMLLAEGSCLGGIDLYTIDLATGSVTRLLDLGATEGYPRWFPDGKSIAFHQMSADRSSAKLFIAEIKEDGTPANIRRVSEGDFDVEPTPSPDGKWLAYSATLANGKALSFLSLEDLEMSKIFQNGAHVDFPTWVPGQNAVVYHSNISGQAQLYRLDFDPYETRQLTTAPGPNFTGEINPTGTKLVYASERDGDREIYLLDLLSGEDTRLTDRAGRDGYPKFSPDGTKIAFHSWRAEGSGVWITILKLETGEIKTFSCPEVQE